MAVATYTMIYKTLAVHNKENTNATTSIINNAPSIAISGPIKRFIFVD